MGVCRVLGYWLWFLLPAVHAQQSDSSIEVEARVVWGGNESRGYAGEISIDNGTIRTVRNLSLEPESIGSLREQSPTSIRINAHRNTLFGGVDLAIRGSPESRLSIRFADPTKDGSGSEHVVAVKDFLQSSWIASLDDHGNRVAIERQRHDRLRIHSERTQMVFESAEPWKVMVSGYRTGLPAGEYTMHASYRQGADEVLSLSQHQISVGSDGSFPSLSLELLSPQAGGAYRLAISLERRSFLNTFVSTGDVLERELGFVVDDVSVRPSRILSWRSVAKIDPLRASRPGSLAWLSVLDVRSTLGMPAMASTERWQQLNPLATSRQPVSQGTLGSRNIVQSADKPGGGLLVSTQPKEVSQTYLTLDPQAWLAVPLENLRVGEPHRLRVLVPTDRAMELVVSIQQSDGAGEFSAVNLDSGIMLGRRELRQLNPTVKHDVMFWPNGDRVIAILSNTGKRPATIGEIVLERAETQPTSTSYPPDVAVQSAAETKDAIAPHDSEAEVVNAERSEERRIGVVLDKPLWADGFSAGRERDPVTGRSLESWNTWQVATDRLVQWMDVRSANTLMLTGFADGGGLFPNERLLPTHRYDSGTFFSDSRSPEIKDGLELLLRKFDRSGKHLILGLDLSTPLPYLSRLEQEDGDNSLYQVNLTGEVYRHPNSDGVGVPRYNPLDARVQDEIATVVQTLVAKYGAHPAFDGIAIQLDRHSQLVFAGDRWGFDDHSLGAFADFAQVKLAPRSQLVEQFQETARRAFLDWRAAQLAVFYARLGDIVARSTVSKSAKLYLNPVRLWDNYPHPVDHYQPARVAQDSREYLLACGVSVDRLAKYESVKILGGVFDARLESVNSRDWVQQVARSRSLNDALTGNNDAAVLLHQPQRHELVAAERIDHSVPGRIYPIYSSPMQYARRKLVEQVYRQDPLLLLEGSWLPECCYDETLSSLTRTLSAFPPIPLTDSPLPDRDANVRLRTASYQGKSYIQLVNSASWSETIQLQFQTPLDGSAIRVIDGRDANLQAVGASSDRSPEWSVVLEPFDVIGLEVDWPTLGVKQFRHQVLAGTQSRIANELAELERLIAKAADPTQQELLANIEGDFERWTASGVPVGWSVSSLPQVKIEKSDDLPHTGRSSLMIESTNLAAKSVWVQSRAFAPPRTGRLTVQAWLRAPAVGETNAVRLSVIGRTETGERFERSQQFGGSGSSKEEIAIDWGRRPATLNVSDIPVETTSELIIAVDLLGPGKIWLDDVEVFETALQPEERIHLRGQLMVAKQKLTEGNLFPAEQLLDSYWGQYLLQTPEESLRSGQNFSSVNSTSERASTDSPQSSTRWSGTQPLLQQFRESMLDRWRR